MNKKFSGQVLHNSQNCFTFATLFDESIGRLAQLV